MGIGPEVANPLAAGAAVEKGARDNLSHRDGKHGIRLVIAVHDVEVRVEPLNPGIFQLQGFNFAGNNRPFHGAGGQHHLPRARVQLRDVLEIVGQARPQVFGLAYVDDALVFIAELINARLRRNGSWGGAIGGWICQCLILRHVFGFQIAEVTDFCDHGFFIAGLQRPHGHGLKFG